MSSANSSQSRIKRYATMTRRQIHPFCKGKRMAENSPVKKLGVKPSQKMLILNAPEGYLHLLEPLPEGVEVKTSAEGTFDFVQAFVYNKADVDTYGKMAMR